MRSFDRDRERFFEGDFLRVPPGDFDRLFLDFFDLGDLDRLLRRFLPSSPSAFSFSFSFSFFSLLGAGDKLFSTSGFGTGDPLLLLGGDGDRDFFGAGETDFFHAVRPCWSPLGSPPGGGVHSRFGCCCCRGGGDLEGDRLCLAGGGEEPTGDRFRRVTFGDGDRLGLLFQVGDAFLGGGDLDLVIGALLGGGGDGERDRDRRGGGALALLPPLEPLRTPAGDGEGLRPLTPYRGGERDGERRLGGARGGGDGERLIGWRPLGGGRLLLGDGDRLGRRRLGGGDGDCPFLFP